MGKRFRLLAATFTVVVLSAAATPGPRERDGGTFGFVSGVSDGTSVVVHAKRLHRATSDPGSTVLSVGARAGAKDGEQIGKTATSRALTPAQLQAALDRICVGDGICGTRQGAELNPLLIAQETPDLEPAPEDVQQGPAPARIVTIEDLARFLPATVTLHAEPDGWAVIGVPANFWTYVKPVTVDGELLGERAQVRFTPQLYRWNYGDGDSRTTRSGGSSWAGAGQEELSETPTSHRYRAKAQVDASVSVIWSAEYRFADGGWTAVAGAVTSSSPDERMLVVKERTVLTAR